MGVTAAIGVVFKCYKLSDYTLERGFHNYIFIIILLILILILLLLLLYFNMCNSYHKGGF